MPVSRIEEICDAYESGVGHGLKKDGNDTPYLAIDLKEAWQIGYNSGTEIADEKAAKELSSKYQKYEFCEGSGCLNFNGVKCEHDGKNPILCNRTAKEFHKWLKENGFEIVKAVKDG